MAEATGVTARALHHDDDIGLLLPDIGHALDHGPGDHVERVLRLRLDRLATDTQTQTRQLWRSLAALLGQWPRPASGRSANCWKPWKRR